MIDFRNRSYQKELLDQEDIPFKDIEENMRELNFINSWLGGHDITIRGFKNLLNNKKIISVCEIGCGGGDNLMAIYKWCLKNQINVKLIGVDINPECISFAEKKNIGTHIQFIQSDYKKVIFTEPPDIIFSSLFCHHFSDAELVEMIKWMKGHSKYGFFINDLHRHPIAYNFIKIATKFFSRSYLVKNDAPLSVLRAFKKNELKELLFSARLKQFQIIWCWAFRYLIIYKNASQ